MQDRVTIKIPRQLYNTLKEMVEGTGFSSVNEFIVFTMRSLASGGHVTEEGRFTEQVNEIRQRLRRLGWL